ncbi:MAG: sigma-54-dependent Fis family transcriptional regulator [Deltaproteobacteria bacterium]|nr:sigma-54-dependent Fis family transcriptional regulator [Deltaproteobacteria bacterium]
MDQKTSVLVVDDDDSFRVVLSNELKRRGYQVANAATGEAAIQEAAAREPHVILLDLRLPDRDGLDVLASVREANTGPEVIILTGHGTIDTAIEATRAGAFDYVLKPCPVDELEIRIQRAMERRGLIERNTVLERGLTPSDPASGMVGASPAYQEMLELVDRVAPTDSSVLIMGETGVGKEVLAKLIHSRGPRAERPFVVVECAALQESLLLSELFGHERGAFTGADRAKPGLFEVAAGGTVFLDEIGEVSLSTQVRLLRVLDTSTFRRVGGTAEIQADFRVLAATNRDLPERVRQGLFREDLYYRMSTITAVVPPLRERPEDIDALIEHFTRLFNRKFGTSRRVGREALDALRRHSWPGNVRELFHAIEGSMIVCDGPEILPSHLPCGIRDGMSVPGGQGDDGALVTLKEAQRRYIERVLKATGGKRAETARILGISERNLYRKLDDMGLG